MQLDLPDLPFEREVLRCLERSRVLRKIHLVNGLQPQTLRTLFDGEAVGPTITATNALVSR